MLRQGRDAIFKALTHGTIFLGSVEIITHLPSEGRSSKLYHYIADEIITPLTRILDPEGIASFTCFHVRQLNTFKNLVTFSFIFFVKT